MGSSWPKQAVRPASKHVPFPKRRFRGPGKHDPEHRDYHVETCVRVGKRFGEAFIKADVEAFANRPRTGFLKQMRRHVQPGHRGPPTSQWEGHVARATGDIQHSGSSANRATKSSASGTPMVSAIAPKLPAIQGARIASFIWSRFWLFMVISFSNSIAPFSRMMVAVRPQPLKSRAQSRLCTDA